MVNRSDRTSFNHLPHRMKSRSSIAFISSMLLALLPNTSSSHKDSTRAEAKGKGRVTIVYQDDAILPENRDAIKKIRDSGVFERMADRLTKTVALPHDLQIVVTDKTPKGVDVATTEVDGRTIFWPPAFSKATYDVLAEFLPEVIASKGVPSAISMEN